MKINMFLCMTFLLLQLKSNGSFFILNTIDIINVQPKMRGLGLGKSLFSASARIAIERDCKRLDW